MSRSPRPGDLVEIATPAGLAYAQYTHRHPTYGAVLRVFDALHASRPAEPSAAASGGVRFVCLFPLRAALSRGLVALVGSAPLPPGTEAFPLFRTGVADVSTRKVSTWWLWDGEREWPVGSLTEEQRRLPIRGVWNDTLLVERITSGWRPEHDPA